MNGLARDIAENWPFKDNNEKEALELGKALLLILATPGAEINLKRNTYHLQVEFRCHRFGKKFHSTQSAFNEKVTIAGSFLNAIEKEQQPSKERN